MPYPQAPWTLQGYAFLTLQLLDIDCVRPFIPSELNIISVLPGKTIGGVYLSNYSKGSVLEYNELIIVAGWGSYAGKFGGWVSHIYVDNSDSVAGGREIWGMPKELAEFNWQDKWVTVRQGNRVLCRLSYNQQNFGWQLRLGASSFSTLNSNLLLFPAEVEARMGLVGAKLEIPPDSPFGGLNIGQPLLTIRADRLHLKVDAPAVVGKVADSYK